MTVLVSGPREQMVRSLVEEGHYPSEDAVIDAALKLLEERDELAKLESLRSDVAIGSKQVARGESAPFDPQATLDRIRSRRPNPAAGA